MNELRNEKYMRLALAEAIKGRGHTGESPMVGAVIVENGEVVARGHYEHNGGPHAEVNCLTDLGREPLKDAELFVTLEPCSTKGRTGACTDVIIKSGIKNVIIGAIDPNPAHKGAAIDILKNAGINVGTHVLEKECDDLNPEFNERMRAKNHAA